jgi:hypothetical protein
LNDTTDTSWLDEPSVRIEAHALPKDSKRGKTMSAKRRKAWDCDGEFVYFRPKLANPATKERLTTQLAKGELKYMTTSDDVQIYAVQETSPFARPTLDMKAIDLQTLCREIRMAAVRRQWAVFLDGLEELASRFKNCRMSDGKPPEAGFAKILYSERLSHIFNMIRMSGGPSQEEIDREVQALRQRRGADVKRILVAG